MNRMGLCLFSLVALWLSPATLPAEELLRWKFAPGTSWQVAIEQSSVWHTTIGGKTTQSRLLSQLDMVWTIREVNSAGAAIISQKFDRMRMTRESAKLETLSYDSTASQKPSGDAKIFAEAVEPLKNATATLVLSPRGEMLDFTLDDQATAALAKLPDGHAWKDGQNLRDIFRNSWSPLPEEAVSPGSKWTHSITQATPLGTITAETTCSLAEVTDSTAHIEESSQLTLSPSAAALEKQFSLKNHRQSGHSLFDLAAGRLVRQESEQDVTTVSIRKENAIEVRLENRQTLTLTEKK